jgi:hypothetical protein
VAPWTVPYAWKAYANDARGRFFDSVISTRVRVLPVHVGTLTFPRMATSPAGPCPCPSELRRGGSGLRIWSNLPSKARVPWFSRRRPVHVDDLFPSGDQPDGADSGFRFRPIKSPAMPVTMPSAGDVRIRTFPPRTPTSLADTSPSACHGLLGRHEDDPASAPWAGRPEIARLRPPAVACPRSSSFAIEAATSPSSPHVPIDRPRAADVACRAFRRG